MLFSECVRPEHQEYNNINKYEMRNTIKGNIAIVKYNEDNDNKLHDYIINDIKHKIRNSKKLELYEINFMRTLCQKDILILLDTYIMTFL